MLAVNGMTNFLCLSFNHQNGIRLLRTKKNINFWVFLVSTFFTFSVLGIKESQADKGIQLRLAGPKFPPYYFYNDQGKPAGELVRLYSLIVHNAGFSWEGSIIPARRVMKSLTDGVYDSSILVKNPLLEKSGNILTSPEPISEIILNVYFRKGEQPVHSKDLFSGKKLAVMRGYGYGGLRGWLDDIKNNVTLYKMDSFDSVIRLLESGRVDYGLLYDVNFATGEQVLDRKAINLSHNTMARVPLFFHINKKQIPNAQYVMDQLMISYRELVEVGSLAESKYLPDEVIKQSETIE